MRNKSIDMGKRACYTKFMLRSKFSAFLAWIIGGVFYMGMKVNTLAVSPFCAQYEANTNDPRIDTALGCIPVRMESFVTWLLPKLFSIIGGISFLLMVYGFILVSTSKGDPKVVQGAKETITSAITGLLVSIFALFILRLVAVDILHIPGIN